MTEQLNAIQDATAIAYEQTQVLLEHTEDLINDNIEILNTISDTIAEAMEGLLPIVDQLTLMSAALTDAIIPFYDVVDALADASWHMDEGMEVIKQMTDALDQVTKDMERSIGAFNNGLSYLEDAGYYLRNIMPKSAINCIRNASYELQRGGTLMQQALRDTQGVTKSIDALMESGEEVNEALREVLSALEDSIDEMIRASSALTGSFEACEALITTLTEKEAIHFIGTDESYEEAKESLSTAVGDTAQSVRELNALVNTETHILLDDIQGITDQFFVVLDVLIDLTESIITFDFNRNDFTEDVSTGDSEEQIEGKVAFCSNIGIIQGDINVGGIAGAMGFESVFSPEDDIERIGDKNQIGRAHV